MRLLARHRHFLRSALLVLLALGMVIQPTLGALSELHDAEHAAAHIGEGHDDPGYSGHGHDGNQPEPNHTAGAHGLLHQAASPSVTLPDTLTYVPPQIPTAPHLPESGPFGLPGDAPSLPFRPPIA